MVTHHLNFNEEHLSPGHYLASAWGTLYKPPGEAVSGSQNYIAARLSVRGPLEEAESSLRILALTH